MSGREDSDSDAPEEFTSQQGILQDEEIRKVHKENKARVIREGKEQRRLWAQRLTPREPKRDKRKDATEVEINEESEGQHTAGMLPSNIVQLLAAEEKKVLSLDSDDEKADQKPRPRKKSKTSRIETVILNDMPPPKCLQSSLEFLKKKKMQVPRSSSVLNNPNQALRLISSSGLLN